MYSSNGATFRHVEINGYRHYQIQDGNQELVLPGVTSILQVISKPHLVDWSARESCRFLERHLPTGEPLSVSVKADLLRRAATEHQRCVAEACAIGTATHALIEERLRTGTLPDLRHVGPSARSCALRFDRWWSNQGWECIATEKLVFSRQWGYAGLLDCLARRPDGALTVVDWKTSNRINDEYLLQAMAYKHAIEEMDGITVKHVAVVRFGRFDNSVDVVHVRESEHARLLEVFLTAKRLWDWKSAQPTPFRRRVGQPTQLAPSMALR